jgi:hypothetical protein
MVRRPNAVGLLLCEKIIIEENTRNVTLVNIVKRVSCKTFPSPPQQLGVFAVLTDGSGSVPLSLVVSRLDTLEEIAARQWSMQFTDPLREVRLVLRLSALSFPAPGRYQFSLLADGEWVAHTVIQVVRET